MNAGFAHHARALTVILGLSFVGILATAGFQLLAIRGLGTQQFGLFAAAASLINILAIGSASLRSAIAVNVAQNTATDAQAIRPARRIDASLSEALVLSGIGALLVLVLVGPLNAIRGISPASAAILIVIAAPTFLFARAQGLLQGAERSRDVVIWTTAVQILQFGLALFALIAGLTVPLLLLMLLAAGLLGTIGASMQARRMRLLTTGKPFTAASITVLIMSTAFAWLTNIDVVYVAAQSETDLGSFYAASAVLVKTTFIIPTTLMLYLLPRFARSRAANASSESAMRISLLVTLVSALLIFAVLLFLGGSIATILFGDAYQGSASLLPWMTLMWVPWALAQTLLIKFTASASRFAAAALIVAGFAQWIVAMSVLPSVELFIVGNGLLGLLLFTALFVTHRRQPR